MHTISLQLQNQQFTQQLTDQVMDENTDQQANIKIESPTNEEKPQVYPNNPEAQYSTQLQQTYTSNQHHQTQIPSQPYYSSGYPHSYSNQAYPPPSYYPNYHQSGVQNPNYYLTGYPQQQYQNQRPPQFQNPVQYPQQIQGSHDQSSVKRQDSEASFAQEQPLGQSGAQGHLFKTHYPNNTPQQQTIPNAEICGACHKPGASIKCISQCKKFYHKECTDSMGCKTVHQSESNGSYFIQCENCILKIQRCQHCQQMGQVGLQMVKCSLTLCPYFFHKKCQEKEQTNLPHTVLSQLNSPVFVCGAHHCHECSQPFRIDEQIVRCIQCVASYHQSCKENAQIQQITSKSFVCQSHLQSEQHKKRLQFIDSKGQFISHDTRMLAQPKREGKEEDQEIREEVEDEGSRTYKRMRINLKQTLEQGTLLQVQRQAESANLNQNIFSNRGGLHGQPLGPPASTQSLAQWRRVDPSETMVLNSTTLQKVNDILQQEIMKRQQGKSLKSLEKQWNENFQKEFAGKSVKRISKVYQKYQRTDKAQEKQKHLLESKFEEFSKFVMGEHDSNLKVKIYE